MTLRRLSLVLAVVAGLALPVEAAAAPHSLRFFGNGYGDIDRVKIRVDDPATANEPARPADVGARSFTIEFWMKTARGNTAGPQTCGWGNLNWIYGNIVIDRDRYNQGRKFGLSLAAGRLVFGVTNGAGESRTICGDTDLRNGKWHHVAVQRRRSDGMLWIWVDGRLEAKGDGPNGDVSYPNGGVPGNYCGGPCTKSDPFLVIGAEKHDAGSSYPSYHGWIDELRLSDVLRYKAPFTPRRRRFTFDAGTAALYHMNEGRGNVVGDARGLSDGMRKFGGDPAGPIWSSHSPF